MLHMLVNTHNPESCAFRSDADEAAITPALDTLGDVASGRGASVEGWWVNPAGHTFFILIDAPNAHVVDEIVREAALIGRTHTQVHAVIEMRELRDAMRRT